MIGDLLQRVTSILDPRFLLTLFFPNFLFWGLLLIVVFAGRGDLSEQLQTWTQQNATVIFLQTVSFIGWVTFISYVLNNQIFEILRFYEGYWSFPVKQCFERFGKRHYRIYLRKVRDDFERHQNLRKVEDEFKRHQNLSRPTLSASQPNALKLEESNELKDLESKIEKYKHQLYRNYPSLQDIETQVMPTQLGNILKNSELYPHYRYHIDPILIWPRLYHLLPENFVHSLGEAKRNLDFMLIISFLSGLFAILSGLYLLVVGAVWWLFLFCFWGGFLLALFAYQGALSGATLYASHIKAAFDLYRHDLLKQFRLPLPENLEEERNQWRDICIFLYRHQKDYLPLKRFEKILQGWHYVNYDEPET